MACPGLDWSALIISHVRMVHQVAGLQRLVLAGNTLSPVAVVDLANAIMTAAALRELDLSGKRASLHCFIER